MIHCSSCLNWYHARCLTERFEYSFQLSLLQADLFSVTCLTEHFRELGNYIFEHIDNLGILEVCSNWNKACKSNLLPEIFLKENSPNMSSFSQNYSSATAAARGFDNKKSNCWASACMQILHSLPIREATKNASGKIGKVLNDLFTNMSRKVKGSMSILDLKRVTDTCGLVMSVRNHQDLDELIKNIFELLCDDPVIGLQVSNMIEFYCVSIKRCQTCSEVQGEVTEETTHNLPLVNSTSNVEVSISSHLYS